MGSRYWQDRVWHLMGDFSREVGLVRRGPRRPADAPRHMVLLAAYLGSSAPMTAQAIALPCQEVRAMAGGRFAPTAIEMERLHDWVACALWRHLWRAGSPAHATRAALADVSVHATRLHSVPDDWARDMAWAAAGVQL